MAACCDRSGQCLSGRLTLTSPGLFNLILGVAAGFHSDQSEALPDNMMSIACISYQAEMKPCSL